MQKPLSCARCFSMEEFQTKGKRQPNSFSAYLLPSLGARINQAKKPGGWIISPYNSFYRAWETFLLLQVIYSAWICPFEFAFQTHQQDTLWIVDNIISAFFAVDIILTFFLAYIDRDTCLLVGNRKKIAVRYMSTWFVFDVCSTIPHRRLGLLFTKQTNGIAINVLTMLRLWRLRRVSQLFARLEKDIRLSYLIIRCTKLISVTLFTLHSAGCFNYFIAERHPDVSRTWIGAADPYYREHSLCDRYITAIYWAITTLSTTGYGDLHAENTTEMIFYIFFMLFNLAFTSYLIGNITNLVVHHNSRTRKFRDAVRAASEFATRNHLPPRIEDQIISHICLKFKTEPLKQHKTLSNLPKGIHSSISHYLFFHIAQTAYLFRGVSHDLLFQLVCEMEAEYFPPNEHVILENQDPAHVYILVSGAAEITAKIDGHDRVIDEVGTPGDVFGEMGALCCRFHPFAVRTTQLSQILQLRRGSLVNRVKTNPVDGRVIMNNLVAKVEWVHGLGLSNPSLHPDFGFHNRVPGIFELGDKVHKDSTKACFSCSERRVTIHMQSRNDTSQVDYNTKLVTLPDSIQELLRLAARKFEGCKPTKVFSVDNAEIDDMAVIRDGDHLYLL